MSRKATPLAIALFGFLVCSFSTCLLATESEESKLCLTLETEFTLESGDGYVCSVDLSPDRRYVAVGDTSGTVVVRDLVCRKTVWQRDAHPSEAIGDVAVSFLRGGQTLLVASIVNGLELWRVADGTSLRVITASAMPFELPVATRYSANQSRQEVFGIAGDILVSWNASNGKLLNGIAQGAGRDVACLSATQNRNLVATGSIHGHVSVYAWPSGKKVFYGPVICEEHDVDKYPVRSIKLSPDGQLLVAGWNGGITCWDLKKKDRLWSCPGRCLYSDAIAISHDGSKLLCGTGGAQFAVRDIRNGNLISTKRYGKDTENWTAFAFGERGSLAAAGSDDLSVAVWKVFQNSSETNNRKSYR